MNNGHINSLDEDLFTVEAKHHYATQSKTKPKPYISPYDGVVGPTSFMDNLKLKIGAKMMIIYNIDTADGLTNGQMGTLVHIVKTTKGEVDKLIIRLNNSKAGKKIKASSQTWQQNSQTALLLKESTSNTLLERKAVLQEQQPMLYNFL